MARDPLAEEELEEEPPGAAAPNDENAVSEPLRLDAELGRSFRALCEAMWEKLLQEPAFKDWPEAVRPGRDPEDSPYSEQRAQAGATCALQFRGWLAHEVD